MPSYGIFYNGKLQSTHKNLSLANLKAAEMLDEDNCKAKSLTISQLKPDKNTSKIIRR